MPSPEQVHVLFRGSAEFGKRLRSLALFLETIGGGIGVYGVFAQGEELSAWHPLAAFALVASSAGVRGWAGHVGRFADTCRRESARAYALGEPVTERAGHLFDDASPLAGWMARRLPASTIEEYYEPEEPAGEPRLREMYAHSAYTTWRLLRVWAWVMTAVGLLVGLGTFAVAYWLVTAPPPRAGAMTVLNALCSVALAVLTVRAVGTAIASAISYWETRKLTDTLLTIPLPSGLALHSLVHEYDIERACGPPVPTWLYTAMRSGLARDWVVRSAPLRSGQPASPIAPQDGPH